MDFFCRNMLHRTAVLAYRLCKLGHTSCVEYERRNQYKLSRYRRENNMKTKIASLINNVSEKSVDIARKTSLLLTSPTEKQAQTILFVAGVLLLAGSGVTEVFANVGGGIPSASSGDIVDNRIANAVSTIFAFLEGSFGALIMAASGIGAIMSAAFGQYKAALSCIVVAVGAFILRNLMNTFFNTSTIEQNPGY